MCDFVILTRLSNPNGGLRSRRCGVFEVQNRAYFAIDREFFARGRREPTRLCNKATPACVPFRRSLSITIDCLRRPYLRVCTVAMKPPRRNAMRSCVAVTLVWFNGTFRTRLEHIFLLRRKEMQLHENRAWSVCVFRTVETHGTSLGCI